MFFDKELDFTSLIILSFYMLCFCKHEYFKQLRDKKNIYGKLEIPFFGHRDTLYYNIQTEKYLLMS